MAVVIVINPERTDPWVELRNALREKKRALKMVGAVLESGAQRAFEEERFGDRKWPGRYPNQADPFINVAGAMADFEGGAEAPKGRRFDRRPALTDTGNLAGSIASKQVGRNRVEVGTMVEYAADHQWGLTSSMRLTKGGKQRLAKWLLGGSGRPYRKKMVPLLSKTSHDTDIVQRPFLGVTEEMEDDIQRTVEIVIAEAAGGGS